MNVKKQNKFILVILCVMLECVGALKSSNKPKGSALVKPGKMKKLTKDGENLTKVTEKDASTDNDTDISEDVPNMSDEGEIIGLNDLEQMAALASKRNSTFSMEDENSSKRNSQHSEGGEPEPVVTANIKCVRFNMEPEINQFEVLSSQSEAPEDSESDLPFMDRDPTLRRSGGPMEVEQEPVDMNTNVDPTEFGIDGPVLVVTDVSCQTEDELDDDDDPGENDPFLPAGSPHETTTEFHDTHQTVYIHRSPQGSPEEEEREGNHSINTQTHPQPHRENQCMLYHL